MKIRKGFVSNSSSSSYICDVSGEIQAGFDMSLDDAGMYQCENDHIFQDEFLIKVAIKDKRHRVEIDENLDHAEAEATKEMSDTKFEEWYEGRYLDKYGIPATFCPICTFKNIIDRELLQYFLKKDMSRKKDVIREIQQKFKNYKSFSNFIAHDHIKVE